MLNLTERRILQNVKIQNETSNFTECQNTKHRKYMYSTLYEKFPWAFLSVNSVIEEVVAEMKGYSVG